MNTVSKLIRLISTVFFLTSGICFATEFSAGFKNADVEEFINTVGKNLNRTIIIEPSVQGKINVRSYDMMNEEQYYQFFLSVLDVHGFSVVPMDNGVIKVIRSKNATTLAVPLADEDSPGVGDELVTRILPVHNIPVRELSLLLRQINDNSGGYVVHHDQSNVLLITGRAAIVNRLVTIVSRVDKSRNKGVSVIKLKYSSAGDIVKIINDLHNDKMAQDSYYSKLVIPKLAADERTNSVIVSGEDIARTQVIELITELDREQQSQGNTRVFYLKHGKAKDMLEVIKGVGSSIEAGKNNGRTPPPSNTIGGNLAISADDKSNALVITAQPDIMAELDRVIKQLDIRRAQVLVEAIIVELADSDALDLGVQWGNAKHGGTQFPDSQIPINSLEQPQDGGDSVNNLLKVNGMAAGFFHGDWNMLATALSSNTKNDILSTPSLVIMDNEEGSFNVGQEVPRKGTEQSSSSGDSIFTSVEYKTVGTKLVVTPQINEGDSVLLKIEQEVSSVEKTADANNSSSLGPTFNTRAVKNAVQVRSGETVVIGGMMDEQTKDNVSKVPILGDIPLLGYLFRYTGTSTSKRNLMVFIRPTILRNDDTYSDISNNKYENFRDKQINAASQERYLTSPQRQILPQHSGDILDKLETNIDKKGFSKKDEPFIKRVVTTSPSLSSSDN